MLKDRWTLITGASRGLGAAIALELARRGYNVVIHYNSNKEAADTIVAQCRQHGVKAEVCGGDFSTKRGVKGFITRYQSTFLSTSHLVNNFGPYLQKSGCESDVSEWDALYQSNLSLPIHLSQTFLPTIIASRGCIVNIGMVGLNTFAANTYNTAYICLKQALWLWTKSLAKELANKNVRVNMVSPGYLEHSSTLPADVSALPMGRLATAKECARVVAFLMEPSNSYITGQNIEVAGAVKL